MNEPNGNNRRKNLKSLTINPQQLILKVQSVTLGAGKKEPLSTFLPSSLHDKESRTFTSTDHMYIFLKLKHHNKTRGQNMQAKQRL
jgi:hypothetical protein